MRLRKLILAGAVLPLISLFSCGGGGKEAGADSTNAGAAPAAQYETTDGQLLSSDGKPMLVDFYADWCKPCREMKPVFDSLKNVYGSGIDFVSINVDENRNLAEQYRIEAIPCLVFIAPDGTELHRLVGYQDGKSVEASITRYLQ